jgi:hypothetical protein
MGVVGRPDQPGASTTPRRRDVFPPALLPSTATSPTVVPPTSPPTLASQPKARPCAVDAKMRRLLVVALYIGSAMAQTVLDYSKLPACAKQCTVLAQAEGGCVPPAAPVTSQGIYQSCVCQSALLTQLHTSGAVCQTTGCSADDAAKITTYYNALCAGPVVEPAPTTTLVTTSSSTATGTATAGAAGGVKNASTAKTDWCVERSCALELAMPIAVFSSPRTYY